VHASHPIQVIVPERVSTTSIRETRPIPRLLHPY
jgi:hypothetical protein